MINWKPIEQAPVDGSYFLIYIPEAKTIKFITAKMKWSNTANSYIVYSANNKSIYNATHYADIQEPTNE